MVILVVGFGVSKPTGEVLYSTGKLPLPRPKTLERTEAYAIYVNRYPSADEVKKVALFLESIGLKPMVIKETDKVQLEVVLAGPFKAEDELKKAKKLISLEVQGVPVNQEEQNGLFLVVGPIPKGINAQNVVNRIKSTGIPAKQETKTVKRTVYRLFAGRFTSLTELQKAFHTLERTGINPISIKKLKKL